MCAPCHPPPALRHQLHVLHSPQILRRHEEAAEQHVRQRRRDDRPTAKSHDRHAGRHAPPVREPAEEGGDGRDIAEAEADAAEHAVAEVEHRERVGVDPAGGDQQAAAPAARRHRACNVLSSISEMTQFLKLRAWRDAGVPTSRGPTSSSQRPPAAALSPRHTIAVENTGTTLPKAQSVAAGATTPISRISGLLNMDQA